MSASPNNSIPLNDAKRVWIAERQWFHTIDFGDGAVSLGRFDERLFRR